MGAGHVIGLAWSPAGDRIAIGFDEGIYTFATDGYGFTQVIPEGSQPYWSPDGSQLAYTIPCWKYPQQGGLEIADADGTENPTRPASASHGATPLVGASRMRIDHVLRPVLHKSRGIPIGIVARAGLLGDLLAVRDHRGHVDSGQDVTDVGLVVHAGPIHSSIGRLAQAKGKETDR